MSARRTTIFVCDTCGREQESPSNYDLPPGFEYRNPAGEEPEHICPYCRDPSDFASGPKDEWDEQMKEDYENDGPLRQLAEKGLKDYREGRTEPLPGADSSEDEE